MTNRAAHILKKLVPASLCFMLLGIATAVAGPLSSQDIGAVGAAGSYSVSGGTHTVVGSGADIWATADEFRFAYQSLPGDGQIIARVASVTNTNAWTKAGVMIRESLAADSRHVSILLTPSNGFKFEHRSTTGGTTVQNTATYSGTAPQWVRIVRSGNAFSAYTSTDGASWTLRDSVTIALPTTVFVGLAVTSHLDGTLATGVFDNVTVVPSLTSQDIGAVGAAGSYSVSGGTHTVVGSGADIWGTADEFRFAYQSLSGDGQIIARVASVTNTNAWTKAGVMIRESLTADSRHVSILLTPSNGFKFEHRSTTGGTTVQNSATYSGTAPHWVRIIRSGNAFSTYTSVDGTSWTFRDSVTIALPTTVFVGLAVTSRLDGTLATAVFDNLTLSTDIAAPTDPTSPAATALSSSSIQVTWSGSTDDVGVTGYRVERCQGASCTTFAEVGAPAASPFNDTGLTAATTYRYRVRATDTAANLSGYSSVVSATTQSGGGGGDTTAPTTPTNFSATAASSSQINLSWTASTDNVGVTGYSVERCQGSSCSNFTEIATPSGTTYNNTGLTASTTYRYRVRARDAVPNYSGYSSTQSATTLASGGDTTPPTAPTGLSVTPQFGGQNSLTWNASSDNVAVTGYLVERCAGTGCSNFSQIATPTTTTYLDTGLVLTTNYSYRVRARDAVPNYSGYSGISSATPADCD